MKEVLHGILSVVFTGMFQEPRIKLARGPSINIC